MTDLAPPVAGLRNIANRSKSPIHTGVAIPMGAEIEVSDDAVADQLVAAGLTDETPVAEDAASKPSRRTKKAQG